MKHLLHTTPKAELVLPYLNNMLKWMNLEFIKLSVVDTYEIYYESTVTLADSLIYTLQMMTAITTDVIMDYETRRNQ